MHTNTCGKTCRQNVTQKEAEKKATEIQELMYRDTTNVEDEMYDYTGNN